MRMIASAVALLVGLLAAGCNGEVVGGGQRPARLVVVSGDLQTATVGQELPQPLVVRVVDEDDRPVQNQLVNFVVTAGGGSVFAGSALTNADGEARERWRLGLAAGDTQRVEARAVDARTGAAVVFAEFRAIATAGPVAQLEQLPPAERTGTAGAQLADSLGVRVRDAYGNVVAGATVSWAATSGGGSVSSATAVTRADGTARVAWTLGPATGAQVAQASVQGRPPVSFTAQVTAGAAVRVEIVTPGLQFHSFGQRISIVVRGLDAFGNPVAGAPVTLVSLNSAVVALHANPASAEARANGSTKIIATLQGTGAADTVAAGVRQVAAIIQQVPFAPINLAPGNSAARSVEGRDSAYNPVVNPPVTWSSTDPAVATVTSAGVVTAHAVGTARIVATGEADSSAVSVHVAPPPVLTHSTIAAGEKFTCALSAAGEAYCWGSNARGALGTGAGTGDSSTPVKVAGNLTFVDLRAHNQAVCALTAAGAVYCWGSANESPVPALMSAGYTYQSVGTGCGITTAGRMRCFASWIYPGQERFPQLTFVTINGFNCGVSVNGNYTCANGSGSNLPQIARLGDGSDECVITTAGRVSCISCDQPGDLSFCIVESPAGTAYTDVAGAYSDVVCAITTGGALHCGRANAMTPVAAAAGLSFVDVTGHYDEPYVGDALQSHFCALTAAGQLYCWGYNGQGQLGDGTTTMKPAPVLVTGGHTWATPRSLSPGAAARRARR